MILWSLQVKAYHLCVVLYVTTLLYAVQSAQLSSDQRQHAVCSLTLLGHPDPATLGVAAADLHCTSSSPIPIGINATYLGRFAPRFTGVQVISNLACQQQAKGYSTIKAARVPLFALLYFCGDYHVTLQQPSVQNISLIFDNDAWNSAVVAVGAQTEVSINQDRFTGNSAGSTLAAFQKATVSVSDGTVLNHNKGRSGVAVVAMDDGKLTLRDASLRYNHAVKSGGAVICTHNASVTIYNTEFHNNTAVNGGGAVKFESQEPVVVANSTFSQNYAELGGGILAYDKAKLTLQDSAFLQNGAGAAGGAAYLDKHSQATVHGCAYTHNLAQAGGGVFCDGCLLTTISTSFTNNSAAHDGGGLFCGGCLLSTINTSFTNNSADGYGRGLDAVDAAQVTSVNSTWLSNTAAHGAALAMTNTPSPGASRNISATLNITTNNFTNNNATYGGGLELQYLIKAVVVNSTFTENHARFGGGLDTFGKVNLTVQNSAFVRNEAATDGGAAYLDQHSQATIYRCTYNNNHAQTGGGLYCEGCFLTTISTAFTNNSAARYGGGLFCSGCLLSTTSTAFTNNSAVGYGGGLDAVDAAQVTSVNSTWHRNTAAKGAALAMTNTPTPGTSRNIYATLEITANNFTNNNAISSGGGLQLENLIEAVVANSTWHSNTAADGAGLMMTNTPSGGASDDLPAVLSVTGSTFINNSATDSGGGLSLQDHVQGTITESNFSTNSAKFGGAMQAQITAKFTAANTSFSRNTAGSSGGALSIDSWTSAAISSCSFSSNNATWGGAIHCFMYDNSLTLTHSILEQNYASIYGGGITTERIGKINLKAVNCTGNYADGEGGAIVIKVESVDGTYTGSGVTVVTVTNSSFSTNHAMGFGGGLHLYNSVQAYVSENCSFVGNTAGSGGAFALETHVNLAIRNSTMQNNLANSSGGALYQQDSTIALVTAGSMILDNTAAIGGGIFCKGNAQIAVTADTLVLGNSADSSSGGGIYAQDTVRVILKDSMLFGNQADSTGGGLALFGAAEAEVSSCDVADNTARAGGGGLYAANNAILTLAHSLIANNTAGTGGGICTQDSAQLLLINGTSVTSNAAGLGGGVALGSGRFDLAQVKRVVQGNNASSDNDIGSALTSITIHGNTSVVGFVNSISKDEGLLHVAVNLSGFDGLPCQGLLVQATLNGSTFLGANRSDQNGMAYMSFKVARPAGAYTVLFETPEVSQVPAAKLSLQVRGCLRGEVTPIPNTCQQCQQGYFSFSPQQAVCDLCPANANCTGGDVILPLPGYWRSSANSTQVHRCLNPSACMVSNPAALQSCAANSSCGASSTFKDLQCTPDYVGNLCGVCAAGRGAIKLFVCKSCMATSHIIALYIIAAVVMLLFIKLLCYLTLNQARNVCLGDTSRLPAAELLRPLILYSQYMLIVSSMNIEWPASLSYPLKVLGWVWSSASPETLSIDCILPKNSSMPVSIQKVLFYVCMPVALLLILMLIELASLVVRRMLLARRVGRHAAVIDLKDRMLSSTLVAVFFFLPSVLRTLFSIFACTQIDQPAAAPYAPAAVGSFWVFDMNQQCFAGYHRAWALGLGLPLVLVVCLGLPSGVLFLLLSNKSKLREESFMQQYGFLYRSYRDGFGFWECIILCQTMLLVATSIFGVNMGVFYQLTVVNGVFMLIVAILLVCKPYLYPQAGRVMLQAICCLLLTSYVSSTFLQVGDVQPSPVYGLVMGSILLVINLAFIISVLWQLARLVDWQGLWSVVQRRVQETLHELGLLNTTGDKGPVVLSKAAPAPVEV